MTDETKTPEQLAAEAATAATAKAAQAAADKAAKKAAADQAKADKTSASAKAKADAKAAKEKAAADKAAAKLAATAAKETAKQPEQNGVRRPKDGGACGNVWATADSMSKAMGQPVPIKELSTTLEARGVNDSTIRTQYALWRKFNGVTGRVVAPVPVATAVAGTTAAAA